jgi:hypothetical protein
MISEMTSTGAVLAEFATKTPVRVISLIARATQNPGERRAGNSARRRGYFFSNVRPDFS